jgi:exoribonuclease-2
MELGNIVEYIDHERILCAVVLEVRNQRLRLLTENNKEVNLSVGRLLHRDRKRLDLSMSRMRMVETLKEVAKKRKTLIAEVLVRELWEVLNSENQWIDLETMTAFCFPGSANGDHQSAVMRALFKDRLYFRFNPGRFFPNPEEQVERLIAEREEQARRQRIIDAGGEWLRRCLTRNGPLSTHIPESTSGEFLNVLRSYFLYGKDYADYAMACSIMEQAGLENVEGLFPVLVKAGIFTEDENVDLHRLQVPCEFPPLVLRAAEDLTKAESSFQTDSRRVDLTGLNLFTIDGQSTLDFDDALSLEVSPEGFRLGVHIVDVGHFVHKEDPIDREARRRGSSIYMPDQKISMLPSDLAEGLCSLKAGEVRPAISTIVDLSPELDVRGYRILPTIVRVKDQRTYFDVNLLADQDSKVVHLRSIARKFREARLAAGAVHISVPEINIWLAENGDINLSRLNRESPGRMLVAEIMILANWLMARFLAENGMHAIFRSQPDPRDRLYGGEEGTLYQHWMQRRLLNRFVLGHAPDKHSGLGLSAYVTATSPIRKYYDLVTQRQIRAVLGMETPYTAEDIDGIIQELATPMSRVSLLQMSRQRYWLLKHLERRIGQKEEAIVLVRRRHGYQILLTEYMLECDLPIFGGLDLKPEDLVQVTLLNVSARKNLINLTIG